MSQRPITACYASCSIGARTSISLPNKLKALSSAGYDGIELSFLDLLGYTRELVSKDIKENDYEALSIVAKKIRGLCDDLHLKVLMLQPFSNFEGWPKGSEERADAFDRAKGWMQIMLALDTKLLQIGSSDAENISTSRQELADDLAELADIFAPKGLSIAYENWCWATRAPTWEAVWDIVNICDRDNVGLCLDTFQIAGSFWADPTTESGTSDEQNELGEENFKKSFFMNLDELSKTIPKHKIFIFQISDAYKMEPPLAREINKDGMHPRSRWSRGNRPFPYRDGYLPVQEISRAVFATGFRGVCSVEVFDHKEQEKYGEDLKRIALDGMMTLDQICTFCKLGTKAKAL